MGWKIFKQHVLLFLHFFIICLFLPAVYKQAKVISACREVKRDEVENKKCDKNYTKKTEDNEFIASKLTSKCGDHAYCMGPSRLCMAATVRIWKKALKNSVDYDEVSAQQYQQ